MKGSTLPTSGYDRYRTDFAKGNAWPLLTRLARNTLTSTVPLLNGRTQPQPRQLFLGESSQHDTNVPTNSQDNAILTNQRFQPFASHQPRDAQGSPVMLQTQSTAVNSYQMQQHLTTDQTNAAQKNQGKATHNTAIMSNLMQQGLFSNKVSDVQGNNMASTTGKSSIFTDNLTPVTHTSVYQSSLETHIAPVIGNKSNITSQDSPNHSELDMVTDLSGIYMPLTGFGINSNTFATYPPIDQNSMNHNKGESSIATDLSPVVTTSPTSVLAEVSTQRNMVIGMQHIGTGSGLGRSVPTALTSTPANTLTPATVSTATNNTNFPLSTAENLSIPRPSQSELEDVDIVICIGSSWNAGVVGIVAVMTNYADGSWAHYSIHTKASFVFEAETQAIHLALSWALQSSWKI
uniref:Uncharacterized protein n=1 Tax=Cannabis sativa TaxID=3483 RepID=A0A803PBU6_CANSA